jgi:hypothetical protein
MRPCSTCGPPQQLGPSFARGPAVATRAARSISVQGPPPHVQPLADVPSTDDIRGSEAIGEIDGAGCGEQREGDRLSWDSISIAF